MTRIQDLPNLGPASQRMLVEAGIETVQALRALGSVAAFARVRARSPRASLNLLWALEGALSGLPWQQVARDHRTSLLLALDTVVRGEAHGDVADAAARDATGPATGDDRV